VRGARCVKSAYQRSGEVAYQLSLPENLSAVHDVFSCVSVEEMLASNIRAVANGRP
jgi:hypothetical protein